MESRNKAGAIFLGIVILLFVIGGYFLMNYMVNKSNDTPKKNKSNQVKEVRIDKTKDYIYYENGEEFLEEAEIHKEDVVLNFKNLSDLNTTLHEELEKLYSHVTLIKDVDIKEESEYEKNEAGIYSVDYREYVDTTYDKYVSLVVLDYNYDVINGSIISNIKSYVVSIDTGELVSPTELLAEFKVSESDILAAVKKRLEDTQVLTSGEDSEAVIDIDGTLNSLKNNGYDSGVKALSVSKNGKLMLNFIVKSNKVNYNDSIEID